MLPFRLLSIHPSLLCRLKMEEVVDGSEVSVCPVIARTRLVTDSLEWDMDTVWPPIAETSIDSNEPREELEEVEPSVEMGMETVSKPG